MSADSVHTTTTKKNVSLFLDLETVVSLPCIIPMLKCIHDLIKMAQSRDIMIQDFIGVVKLC